MDTTLSSLLIENPLRHCGAAFQDEILGTASDAEMADIKQTKRMVPLITREVPFSQHLRVGVWCQCNGFEFLGPN